MSDLPFFSAKAQPRVKRYPPLMKFTSRLLSALLPAAVLVWLVGFFGSSHSAWVLAATLLAIALAYQLWQLFRLNAWLLDPHPESVPDGVGNWGEIFSALYRQEKRRRKDQRRLTATLSRFTLAAEALPDGVVVLNDNDRIEWCNRVAEHHLGLSRKRDLGLTISYLIRQPHFVEYVNNERYTESISLHPVHAPDTLLSIQIFPFEATLKLLVTRDVTQLEKVSVVHRDFVANVSHELRTPLTVVGGFLETLLDLEQPNRDIEHRYMRMMQEQTRRMQRLVDDLLTLSRLESHSGEHREEDVNLSLLLQMLAQEAEGLSGGRHEVVLENHGPAWLRGNRDELHSALGNLVSNAVRYTPEGGRITLRWQQQEDGVCFSVCDTGIGIAPEHLDRLTERFYRVDRSRSRDTGGTGLGLAIVKHALLRHQAQLDIRSASGEGSTFSATFPPERVVNR